MDYGLGLLLEDEDRDWLTANATDFPAACCANETDLPDEFLIPLTHKNQRRTNKCAAHAGSSLFEGLNWLLTGETKVYGVEQLYIDAQRRGGFFGRDKGTSITSILQAGLGDGCCLDATHPFAERYETDIPANARREAAEHKLLGQYARLRGYDAVWRFLSTMSGLIVIGTQWLEGQAALRGSGRPETLADLRGDLLGYHARLFCGWSKRRAADGRRFLWCLNSHGDGVREVAPDVVDHWAEDSLCEMLGASELRPFEPRPISWKETRWLAV